MSVQQLLLAGAMPGKEPSVISGATLWLDFSDPTYTFTNTGCTTAVAANDDLIKGAVNKITGVGGNFTEASQAGLWKTNILNGKAVARFVNTGASGRGLSGSASSTYIANNNATIIAVLRVSGVTYTGSTSYFSGQILSAGQQGNSYFGLYYTHASSEGYLAYNWDGSDDSAKKAQAQDVFVVAVAQHTGGNVRCAVNNTSWASTASGNTSVLTELFNVGNRLGTAVNTLDIGECCAFNSAISDADVSDVIARFKLRWGIA